MYFFLFLPLSTTKIHEHYSRRLGKMRAEGLGTSGTKEQHGGEFPEFSFCLKDPRLDAGKPETQTHQLVQRRKNYKSLLSLVKGSGKVQPNKTENFG